MRVFGVFLAFCVAVIELTRRSGEPAGVRTDLHGVWCLPVALLLPPLYGLVCAIPVEILTQLRVRSALAYRRVFTAAAVGLSYGAASAAFHAVARPASASVTGTTAQALCWLGLAACCGCLQVLINKALVITAVKGAEPETPWRRLLGDGEALYNDLAGLCLAVVVAVPTARVTAAIGFALPLTVLVQRSQRHAELTGQARIDGAPRIASRTSTGGERRTTHTTRRTPHPAAAATRAAHQRDRRPATGNSHDDDLDAYITDLIARAPPLTSQQRDTLALLLSHSQHHPR
jgi:hypothetical protein